MAQSNDKILMITYLIYEKFPERIFFLNDLIKKHKRSNVDLDTENKTDQQERPLDSNAQKYKEYNESVVKMMNIFKPHLNSIMNELKNLKTWISMLKPKIEDGDNFGVDVQSTIISNLVGAIRNFKHYKTTMEIYHIQRGENFKKILKYPTVEDYKKVVDILDEFMIDQLNFGLRDIRNQYSVLFDYYTKNCLKITAPRESVRDNNLLV